MPDPQPQAYSYIRMSTDLQLKGDSLRRQMELSKDYANRHGLRLVEDFDLEDIGVSAFRGDNVTDGKLGDFLVAVKAGKIPVGSYLLVESLDRLSRQRIVPSLSNFMDLLNCGITVVTLTDGQRYTKETGFAGLILSIAIMSRAHDESQMKSHRVGAAWSHKRAQADTRKPTKICPAWLRLSEDRKSYEFVADRVAVVRDIFECTVAGMGSYAIVQSFIKRGIKPFEGSNGWHQSYIAKIINSRAVIGEFQFHKLVDGKRIPEGELKLGYFPAIVDEELFYRAQRARAQRRVGEGQG